MNGWGKIFLGTRLEKQVSATFFLVWMELIKKGLRPGDNALAVSRMVAHKAQNALVRAFLESDCDTFMSLDSDADVDVGFIERFRIFEPGFEYDMLQAFYTRRGWPPRAIWLKNDALGNMMESFIISEHPNEAPLTEDVDIVGTHACLIRRSVFEKLLADAGGDPDNYEWFYYPRHQEDTEDSAFSYDAKAAGFHLGATTAVCAGHICELTTGWGIYQEYLQLSGRIPLIERYKRLATTLAEYVGQDYNTVYATCIRGGANTLEAWARHNPQNGHEARKFYGAYDNGYLYDLTNWNCQPLYERIIAPLREIEGEHVLIVGAGIGTEIEQLQDKNKVTVFELPGVLREYLKWRRKRGHFNGQVEFMLGDDLPGALAANGAHALSTGYTMRNIAAPSDVRLTSFDRAVLIDVIEHIHPDEFDETMDALAEVADNFYIHANFGQLGDDGFPQHFDHTAAFDAWMQRHDIWQTGPCSFESVTEQERERMLV